jgi:hypothetical protein
MKTVQVKSKKERNKFLTDVEFNYSLGIQPNFNFEKENQILNKKILN